MDRRVTEQQICRASRMLLRSIVAILEIQSAAVILRESSRIRLLAEYAFLKALGRKSLEQYSEWMNGLATLDALAWVDHPEDRPTSRQLARGTGLGSWVLLPITAHGETVAHLHVSHADPFGLSESDLIRLDAHLLDLEASWEKMAEDVERMDQRLDREVGCMSREALATDLIVQDRLSRMYQRPVSMIRIQTSSVGPQCTSDLRWIAGVVSQNVRASDQLYRLSDDSLALLLLHVSPHDVHGIAGRIGGALKQASGRHCRLRILCATARGRRAGPLDLPSACMKPRSTAKPA